MPSLVFVYESKIFAYIYNTYVLTMNRATKRLRKYVIFITLFLLNELSKSNMNGTCILKKYTTFATSKGKILTGVR